MEIGESITKNKWDRLYKTVMGKIWCDVDGKINNNPLLLTSQLIWNKVENINLSIKYEKDENR